MITTDHAQLNRAALARSTAVGDSLDSAATQAAGLILDWLTDGPLSLNELDRLAQERGLSYQRVREARETLVKAGRIRLRNRRFELTRKAN
ncbi:MAG: hypothetical protein E6R06_06595 [Mycobacterium sp.]|nr:MAG: hypothetical protein E6R06_06595 [Mycobacterium sp.]